jgi:hypothetical protein
MIARIRRLVFRARAPAPGERPDQPGGTSARPRLALLGAMGAGLMLALTATTASADMNFSPLRGGSGGGAFDIRCGAASYVSGITVFSGWWVDGITAHCGVIDRNNLPKRFFVREAAPYNAPAHTGGWQSRGERISCGADYALIGLDLDSAVQTDEDGFVAYVARFLPRCTSRRCFSSLTGTR